MALTDLTGNYLFRVDRVLCQSDQIKNQRTFADFYNGYGWYGALTRFNTNEMFAFKLASAGFLDVFGTAVSLPKTITLATSGWTWM